MLRSTLSLDHVAVLAEDLDLSAAHCRSLGFQLTRRSPQMGRIPGSEAMAPWGTANHCAVFQAGYLELIGVVDPARHNPWTAFYRRGEGIHIVAFRCESADRTYPELQARAGGFDPPVQRMREAPYGESTRPLRFRNIFSRDDDYPECRFIVIEHQTPEVIWQPELVEHPNGALRLAEVVFCAMDTNPTARRLAGLLATAALPRAGGIVYDLAGGGRVSLTTPSGLKRRFPGMTPPDRAGPAAAVFEVEDMAAARALIESNGIRVQPAAEGGFSVDAVPNGGPAFAFLAR